MVRVEPGISNQSGRHLKNATAQIHQFNEKTKGYEVGAAFVLENKTLPGKLLITEDGLHIVGVDDWFNDKMENPVIVVYDGKGKALKRFYLRDLLSSAEIDGIKPTKTYPFWQPWAKAVVIVPGANELRIIRDEIISGPGKKFDNFTINLSTLAIQKESFGAKYPP